MLATRDAEDRTSRKVVVEAMSQTVATGFLEQSSRIDKRTMR